MADKTRQIGGLAEETNEKGTLYTLILFINAADVATFTPNPIGKPPVSGQVGGPIGTNGTYNKQTGLVLLPDASYIYDFKKRPVGDHWIFTIYACSTNYDWGGSGKTITGSISNRSLKPNGQLYCDPAWWGITRWGNHDDYRANRLGLVRVYDNSRTAKAADDLVFENASHAGDNLGTVVMCGNLTPFVSAGWIIGNAPVAWVDKKIQTVLYTVKLYKPVGNVFDYINWNGINGTWGTGSTPKTGFTDAGMWRAVDQDVLEGIATISSTKQDYLWRVMELVPIVLNTNLRWDSAKNGGTWVW